MTGQPQAPAANRPALSPDQADAWDALAETFQNAGVDLVAEEQLIFWFQYWIESCIPG